MNIFTKKTRRIFVTVILVLVFCFSVALNIFLIKGGKNISKYNIAAAEKIIGLQLTSHERKLMLPNLSKNLARYKKMREVKLDNSISPALIFNPIIPGIKIEQKKFFSIEELPKIAAPTYIEDMAFQPIPVLAQLLKTRQITSVELTTMFINRLEKFGPRLECTITLAKDLALKQAQKADREIASGNYRGLLHGIPWGAKDLLATKGIKTTWGAAPYKDQIIDINATVVEKLEESGAVLIAKISLGALAMGDVWYGGKTRNPWNISKGSSGSSAGPAAAVAAGLMPFAIGSETWGSIVSPSTTCGVTGLRPTFGRVSRYGAMALSWTMDKIGPICRNAEDCAIVLNSIYGPDDKDLSVQNIPFSYDSKIELTSLKIGYLKNDFESSYSFKHTDSLALKKIKELGVKLIPIELPNFPYRSISFILSAEAAAAFDDLTRSNNDDLLVRQGKSSWPNSFRSSRFIPAVEYINANRLRVLLIQEMEKIFQDIDLYIAPSFKGGNLLLTNLTGHPCIVVPNGFTRKGTPVSFCFVGKYFEEGKIVAVAKAFQDATDFHLKHPDMSWGLSDYTK